MVRVEGQPISGVRILLSLGVLMLLSAWLWSPAMAA
jgi:hypothetical protein